MLSDKCNKWWEQMSKHSYWLFQSVSASISFYSRVATCNEEPADLEGELLRINVFDQRSLKNLQNSQNFLSLSVCHVVNECMSVTHSSI